MVVLSNHNRYVCVGYRIGAGSTEIICHIVRHKKINRLSQRNFIAYPQVETMARPKSTAPQKKTMGVALPDDLRKQLEQAAQAAGWSIAEEIRWRVKRTFEEDALDPETRGLLAAIKRLADLVQIQTGHSWYRNLGALVVLQHAIFYRLSRVGLDKIPPLERVGLPVHRIGGVLFRPLFKREELPKVLIVNTLDPREMGRDLENLMFHQEPEDTPV
jgi:hypothetical protein